MSGMKGKLAMLSIMAAMMGGNSSPYDGIETKEIDAKPKEPPIPKGCQRYFFNANGGYNTKRDSYTIFECVASNYKQAKKKFDKFSQST
jgi:hypothetical protein